MTNEDWQKVREIFDDALRQKPEERRRFIEDVCGEDKSLLAEVQSLLSSHDGAKSFMETPAVAKVAVIIEAEPMKLETGRCFGHYEIIRQIGVGGMGEVYLARDKKLDRNVAIKFLNEEFSQDESNLKRFVSEAKAASALNHPNILTIYEFVEAEDARFIVSEYIEGKTLREIIRESSLRLPAILDTSIQITSALSAAHKAHLVHRDIKPENIMVRPDGYVKILDFGLAKLVEQKNKSILSLEDPTVRQNLTAKGVILGTVNYMSPEQAKGERVDERTDIFSLGVLIYEVLAGKPPFAGANAIETMGSILNKDPVPLSRQTPEVPNELERIINKALRKDPEARYQTAKDLLIDLQDLKQELAFSEKLGRSATQSDNQEATGGKPADVTEPQNGQTAPRAESISREIKQHKSGFLLVSTILLLSVMGLGYWFYSNRAAATNSKQIKSIAVLPLENLSGDASQDYFAEGMTEALIGNLSKISSLKVISRTSVMRYKQSGKSIPEIAKELGVDGIVEGSVQRSGDRILITTRLIDAATDSPIWSRKYERQMSDILTLQGEIAQALAGEIRVQLTPAEEQRFDRRKSIDPGATEAFLLGKHYFHMWTRDSERQAVEQFQKAVNIEPEYAEGWAGLSDAWQARGIVGDINLGEAEKPAKGAALKALQIDAENSAAHVSMCFLHNIYDFDWVGSETSCKRGIELDPNNAKAHFAYAYVLSRLERWDEMVEQMEKAMRLDPVEPWWPQVYGAFLIQAHRFEEAEEQLKRAIAIDPNWRLAYTSLSDLYVELGKFDEALKLTEKWSNSALSMAYIYARMGNRQKALDFLNRSSNRDLFGLALVYTALDDFDKAFEVINESFNRGDGFMTGYGSYPVLNKLKSDPRWKDVARRMNMPQTN
jgi:serine/threonine protein kinase/Tfp pilus assembly protein PilF